MKFTDQKTKWTKTIKKWNIIHPNPSYNDKHWTGIRETKDESLAKQNAFLHVCPRSMGSCAQTGNGGLLPLCSTSGIRWSVRSNQQNNYNTAGTLILVTKNIIAKRRKIKIRCNFIIYLVWWNFADQRFILTRFTCFAPPCVVLHPCVVMYRREQCLNNVHIIMKNDTWGLKVARQN